MADTQAVAAAELEAQVTAASRERGEPEWLTERRAEAARAAQATSLPTPRLREWKYLNLDGFDPAAYAPVPGAVTVSGEAAGGGFVGTLAAAAGERAELVREHLGSLIPSTEGAFQALNGAHWTDGAFLHGPRNTQTGPVEITVDAGAGHTAPRLLIVAEERAEVAALLTLRSAADAEVLATGVTEIVAAPGARVMLLIDDRWGAATRDFSWIRSRLGRDADVQVVVLAFGGRVFKQHIDAQLEGEGSNSEIRGVALGDGEQHFDFVTLQDHIGAHSTSNVEIKSALAGASRSVYYGVTRVEVSAKQASAEQANRNLLLSDHAKADSDPVLEILTSDVIRCGHAATVGPVAEDALFYLQSRGLERRAALQLLVSGFFRSAIGDLLFGDVSEQLHDRVVRKLGEAEL